MCVLVAEDLEAERHAWLKVSKTKIYARHTEDGRQLIAYSMSIASESAAAMILPLPVVPGSGEDALRFIDLSGYGEFFDDLEAACICEYIPSELSDLEFASAAGEAQAASILEVHEVGDYEASYVPGMGDFHRLDPRFRLPDEVWKKMPDYSDYGFAVFQLKINLVKDGVAIENTVHPMAFEFPSRDPQRLFFPTVHVHDGDYHDRAGFHHKFFCQRDNARTEFKYQRDLFEGLTPSPAREISTNIEDWFEGYFWFYRTEGLAGATLACERSEGMLDADKKVFAMEFMGEFPNEDMWLGDVCEGTETDCKRESLNSKRKSTSSKTVKSNTEGDGSPQAETGFTLSFPVVALIIILFASLFLFETTKPVAWVLLVGAGIFLVIGIMSMIIRNFLSGKEK